jgi:hypothetical protein
LSCNQLRAQPFEAVLKKRQSPSPSAPPSAPWFDTEHTPGGLPYRVSPVNVHITPRAFSGRRSLVQPDPHWRPLWGVRSHRAVRSAASRCLWKAASSMRTGKPSMRTATSGGCSNTRTHLHPDCHSVRRSSSGSSPFWTGSGLALPASGAVPLGKPQL